MTQWRARYGIAFPVIVVALLGLVAGELVGGRWPAPAAVSVLAALLIICPLAVVRRWPVAVVLGIWTTSSVLFAVNGEPKSLAVFFVVQLCTYCVGAYVETARALAWMGLAFVALIAASELEDLADLTVGDVTSGLLLGLVVAGMGRLVRRRNRAARAARRDAQTAHDESLTAVAEALAQERGRIARDLHDVVAHSVSLMVVQAAAGRSVLERRPDAAIEALHTIVRVGAQAQAELRRLLDVMYEVDEPGLQDIGTLADLSRSVGDDVSLEVDGDLTAVPAGVDRAAYRIVQESLTNARKHAPGAAVSVELRVLAESLSLSVRNAASTAQALALPAGGHGVIGMRERATLYGGTLESFPEPDGWLVRARLRLDSAT